MELQVKIGFEQLLTLVKKLSLEQQQKLKAVLEKNSTNADKRELEKFLLKAPTFSESQFEKMAETRNAINQWRTK